MSGVTRALTVLATAIIISVTLSAASVARAQTAPEDVRATIQRVGGPYAWCLTEIARRETGGTFDPAALNPQSLATGPFQFLPHGGEWDATPLGQQGVPVAVASVAEQVAAAAWSLAAGHGQQAWALSAPRGC